MKEKTNKSINNDIQSALIKKALGYDATETVEEYMTDGEGEIKLSKKKVTKKNVPPDITALKMLLDSKSESISQMTDEELEREKERLLKLLASQKNKKEK